MPRADRLVELVTLLGGRRSRSLREIVEHFDVSERTIYRDLADLGLRNIPVTRDGRGYRLVEGSQLRPLALTAAERAVLKLALANPALRTSPTLKRRLETLEAKLDAASAAVAETPQALTLATVDRSGPVPAEVVETLERAVDERRSVRLDYRSLSGGSRRSRGVDPFRLFHRGDAWYLVGRCHVHDEPRTFRLDRIEGVRLDEETFPPPADFSLDEYLADTWTLFRGRRSHEVVLRFAAELAPLVEAARHHSSEEVQSIVGGEVEYRVRVSHLDEIARWVVGFGGRCRVVKPEELARRVVELGRGAAEAIPAGIEQRGKAARGRGKSGAAKKKR